MWCLPLHEFSFMTDSTLQNLILNTPALKALAIAGQDADILAQIPTYAPPVATPKPFQASDIMGCVTSSDRAKVATSAMYYGIQVAVQAQDRVSVTNEAQLCVDAALITPAEQTAINAVLAA